MVAKRAQGESLGAGTYHQSKCVEGLTENYYGRKGERNVQKRLQAGRKLGFQRRHSAALNTHE